MAVDEAIDDIRNQRLLPVPRHLRDRHYAGAKRLGHGEGYQYPHASEQGWIEQDYLGVERNYYRPVDRGHEAEIVRMMNERLQSRAEQNSEET